MVAAIACAQPLEALLHCEGLASADWRRGCLLLGTMCRVGGRDVAKLVKAFKLQYTADPTFEPPLPVPRSNPSTG